MDVDNSHPINHIVQSVILGFVKKLRMIDINTRKEEYYNFVEGKFKCHKKHCNEWTYRDKAYCKKCLNVVGFDNQKEHMDNVMMTKPKRINIMEKLKHGS